MVANVIVCVFRSAYAAKVTLFSLHSQAYNDNERIRI